MCAIFSPVAFIWPSLKPHALLWVFISSKAIKYKDSLKFIFEIYKVHPTIWYFERCIYWCVGHFLYLARKINIWGVICLVLEDTDLKLLFHSPVLLLKEALLIRYEPFWSTVMDKNFAVELSNVCIPCNVWKSHYTGVLSVLNGYPWKTPGLFIYQQCIM